MILPGSLKSDERHNQTRQVHCTCTILCAPVTMGSSRILLGVELNISCNTVALTSIHFELIPCF